MKVYSYYYILNIGATFITARLGLTGYTWMLLPFQSTTAVKEKIGSWFSAPALWRAHITNPSCSSEITSLIRGKMFQNL